VHPVQEESFEVVSGTMRFGRGRETVLAGPADTVVVPPGIAHLFANAGEGPAVVRVDVWPALRMEQLWETVVALDAEGRTFRSGLPRPLDLALFMREFEHEVRAPFAPGMARAATAPLAWLGARRGLARRYQAPGIGDQTRPRKPAPPVPARAGASYAPSSRAPGQPVQALKPARQTRSAGLRSLRSAA
jgi:hypothetical protein